MNKRFFIVGYNATGGGPIVLRTLFNNLKELGCDVTFVYAETFKQKSLTQFSTKFKVKLVVCSMLGEKISKKVFRNVWDIECYQTARKQKFPIVDDNAIVIYPEVIYGNPLNAKNVVRWFLYYNRYPNDPYAYGEHDLFICYRQQFNDVKLNPQKYQLYMGHYDLDLYKRTNYGERHGKCYCVRKGADRSDLPESFDGPIIDQLSEEEKVKMFNECEYFISYDTQTAYSSIAAMCGCISVIVPEPGKTKADYRSSDDGATYGIAYSFDEKEIQWAIKTRDLVRQQFEDVNEKGMEETKKFVDLCYEYFG